MARNNLKFVDFDGRSVPVWELGGLYYATLDFNLMSKCNAGQFYNEGKTPDELWSSGSTADLAVAAAFQKQILGILQSNNAVLEKITAVLGKLEDQKADRQGGK